jgi:2-methylisocitrate lyase-like PEP mutase family enzyme
MNIQEQARKAEALRKLHGGPRMLVLPNAWDVASARIVEELGFPAIATTSAGIAFSMGYPDGEKISRDEMFEAVGRIASGVSVPVTADAEAGYGLTAKEMADTARALVATGAVGMNFEDIAGTGDGALVEMNLQVEKIGALREASASAGVPLVINARTDIFLKAIGPAHTRFERAVERLRAYRKAGADCVFAPGLKDAETIGKLVKAVNAPVNILLLPGGPSLAELEKLGVARASIGSGLMRAGLGTAREIAGKMKKLLDIAPHLEAAIPGLELNVLMKKER